MIRGVPNRRRAGRRWFAALIVLLASPWADARLQAPSPEGEMRRLDAVLPAGVEVVVTLRGAAEVRRTPAGRAVEAMLADSGKLEESVRAWKGLAESLGWSPAQAFDELLGRRVTIAARGLGGGELADWALIGEVSRATEDRLRLRLRPAPRAIVAGLTVLAVEEGAFELTICSHGGCAGLAGDEGSPDGATFMLAPAGPSVLFDELVPVLARGIGGGGGRDAAPQPAPRTPANPGPGAFMLMRGTLAGGEGSFIAVTAAMDPAHPSEGFHARVLMSKDLLAADALTPPWTGAALGRLEPGAMMAAMSAAGFEPIRRIAEAFGLPTLAGWSEPANPDRRRTALVVREAGSPTSATLGAPDGVADDDLPVSGSSREGVSRGAGAARRPLSIVIARETESPDVPAAPGIADNVASYQNALQAAADEAMELAQPSRGSAAVHETPLAPEAADEWRMVVGDEPTLRWMSVKAVAGASGAGDGRDPRSPGWWTIVALESGDPASAGGVEQMRAALVGERADRRAARRVSVGVVRPGAISRWLGAAASNAPGRALRRIDVLRWDSWRTAMGAVEGELTIRMNSTP